MCFYVHMADRAPCELKRGVQLYRVKARCSQITTRNSSSLCCSSSFSEITDPLNRSVLGSFLSLTVIVLVPSSETLFSIDLAANHAARSDHPSFECCSRGSRKTNCVEKGVGRWMFFITDITRQKRKGKAWVHFPGEHGNTERFW